MKENELETIKIEDEKGDYIVINKEDFDKKIHKEYIEKEEKKQLKKEKKDK